MLRGKGLTMLTRSLWSWTLNFCALKAVLSGCWPGRMGRLCTRKRSRQCCRSGAKSVCATSTSLTCAVSPGATAAAQKDTNQWDGQGVLMGCAALLQMSREAFPRCDRLHRAGRLRIRNR